jgi:YD repeat-containing protein
MYRLLFAANHQHSFCDFRAFVFLALSLGLGNSAADSIADYEPGINPYREQISQDGIESVDPYSGKLMVRYLDLFLPGNGGLDIKVFRTYDTARIFGLQVGSSLLSPMGNGWTFHFGSLIGDYVCEPIANASDSRPVFYLPDGRQFKFSLAPTGLGHLYVSKEGWVADCAPVPENKNNRLIVISPEGIRYEMTVEGTVGSVNPTSLFYVKKITDKHGNWLSFDYQYTNGKAYVSKCTASDGRLVTLTFAPGYTTGTRVSQITANGQTWRYDYSSGGVALNPADSPQDFTLAKVTRPDGKTWIYDYPLMPGSPGVVGSAAQRILGKITHPEGGLTVYEYSWVKTNVSFAGSSTRSRRVTKKTVFDNINPAVSWIYRYKFWESISGSTTNGVSVTDVADPAGGLVTYRHENPNTTNLSSISAWRVGLLVDKMHCSSVGGTVLTCNPLAATRREQYEWGSQLLSADPYQARTGLATYSDLDTYRPLQTKKTITQNDSVYITQYQSHDAYGNPTKIVETGNGTTRTTDLTYFNDPVKWITGLTDKEMIDGSWIVDRSFDANGNVKSLSKYGVTTSFTYHPTGDLASTTDANNHRTDYSDYYRGAPRREDQSGGVTILRTVNPTGTVASETNGEGDRTQYSYDSLNRLSGVIPPTGNPTSILWTTNGGSYVNYGTYSVWVPKIEKRVTRGKFTETTRVDGFGRETDITKRDTATSTYTRKAYLYDALGRKIMESYPTISTDPIFYASTVLLPSIQYTYDPLDRLTKITHADGKTRQLQYLSNNQIKITNENGKVTTHGYRSFGDPEQRELMSVTAPVAAANMSLTRNALGQITSMTQAGLTRTMQYDSRGYLAKVNHPEIGWVTYGRDNVGNPTSKTVGIAPNTRTLAFTYDDRNRLTATTFQDTATPPVTLAYNRVDDIVTATRGSVVRTYDYDANRNLISEALALDGRSFNLGYLYDGNDALSQVAYPDGHIVNYYPDALGRPTAVSPYATSVAYHPSGQVSGMTYANGVTTTQGFNARQWPNQVAAVKSGVALLNTGYGYDGLGNVTSITDSVDASLNRTLGYDAIDRLTSVTGPWGAGSISYDGRGNLLTQNYGPAYSRSYTYDSSNRLATYTGGESYTYDAWGSVKTVENPSASRTQFLIHDDASNLITSLSLTPGNFSGLNFLYDAHNQRVKKTVASSTVSGEAVTYSFYAKDGNLMMEYNPSTHDLKQFAYHNKKQVAMRHVIDPSLVLGQLTRPGPRYARAIPYRPPSPEAQLQRWLFSPEAPLLTTALLAY